ncbi:MAG TPA: 16S rRNA processing protein RimM [Firmicutes bacterium]|nr:16S rRNA processing protein RimM [Bacillota bacterium]
MSSELPKAVIGQILSPHGVKGLVKVYPYSDFPERVEQLEEIMLQHESKSWRLTVEKGSVFGRFWLIKFQGIDSREEALVLKGAFMMIPLAERLPLPEGTYYQDQLIGLQVLSAGKILGRIIDVLVTGGHDLLLMKKADQEGKTLLIPAVRKIVKRVDIKAGEVEVELPEGLLEL